MSINNHILFVSCQFLHSKFPFAVVGLSRLIKFRCKINCFLFLWSLVLLIILVERRLALVKEIMSWVIALYLLRLSKFSHVRNWFLESTLGFVVYLWQSPCRFSLGWLRYDFDSFATFIELFLVFESKISLLGWLIRILMNGLITWLEIPWVVDTNVNWTVKYRPNTLIAYSFRSRLLS
jgi:hypothetical protein